MVQIPMHFRLCCWWCGCVVAYWKRHLNRFHHTIFQWQISFFFSWLLYLNASPSVTSIHIPFTFVIFGSCLRKKKLGIMNANVHNFPSVWVHLSQWALRNNSIFFRLYRLIFGNFCYLLLLFSSSSSSSYCCTYVMAYYFGWIFRYLST